MWNNIKNLLYVAYVWLNPAHLITIRLDDGAQASLVNHETGVVIWSNSLSEIVRQHKAIEPRQPNGIAVLARYTTYNRENFYLTLPIQGSWLIYESAYQEIRARSKAGIIVEYIEGSVIISHSTVNTYQHNLNTILKFAADN